MYPSTSSAQPAQSSRPWNSRGIGAALPPTPALPHPLSTCSLLPRLRLRAAGVLAPLALRSLVSAAPLAATPRLNFDLAPTLGPVTALAACPSAYSHSQQHQHDSGVEGESVRDVERAARGSCGGVMLVGTAGGATYVMSTVRNDIPLHGNTNNTKDSNNNDGDDDQDTDDEDGEGTGVNAAASGRNGRANAGAHSRNGDSVVVFRPSSFLFSTAAASSVSRNDGRNSAASNTRVMGRVRTLKASSGAVSCVTWLPPNANSSRHTTHAARGNSNAGVPSSLSASSYFGVALPLAATGTVRGCVSTWDPLTSAEITSFTLPAHITALAPLSSHSNSNQSPRDDVPLSGSGLTSSPLSGGLGTLLAAAGADVRLLDTLSGVTALVLSKYGHPAPRRRPFATTSAASLGSSAAGSGDSGDGGGGGGWTHEPNVWAAAWAPVTASARVWLTEQAEPAWLRRKRALLSQQTEDASHRVCCDECGGELESDVEQSEQSGSDFDDGDEHELPQPQLQWQLQSLPEQLSELATSAIGTTHITAVTSTATPTQSQPRGQGRTAAAQATEGSAQSAFVSELVSTVSATVGWPAPLATSANAYISIAGAPRNCRYARPRRRHRAHIERAFPSNADTSTQTSSCSAKSTVKLSSRATRRCHCASVAPSHAAFARSHSRLGGALSSLAPLAAGTVLATGGEDGTVRLWDIRTAACFAVLDAGNGAGAGGRGVTVGNRGVGGGSVVGRQGHAASGDNAGDDEFEQQQLQRMKRVAVAVPVFLHGHTSDFNNTKGRFINARSSGKRDNPKQRKSTSVINMSDDDASEIEFESDSDAYSDEDGLALTTGRVKASSKYQDVSNLGFTISSANPRLKPAVSRSQSLIDTQPQSQSPAGSVSQRTKHTRGVVAIATQEAPTARLTATSSLSAIGLSVHNQEQQQRQQQQQQQRPTRYDDAAMTALPTPVGSETPFARAGSRSSLVAESNATATVSTQATPIATVAATATPAGRSVLTVTAHAAPVLQLAFAPHAAPAPSGLTLVSAGGEGVIRLWDGATGLATGVSLPSRPSRVPLSCVFAVLPTTIATATPLVTNIFNANGSGLGPSAVVLGDGDAADAAVAATAEAAVWGPLTLSAARAAAARAADLAVASAASARDREWGIASNYGTIAANGDTYSGVVPGPHDVALSTSVAASHPYNTNNLSNITNGNASANTGRVYARVGSYSGCGDASVSPPLDTPWLVHLAPEPTQVIVSSLATGRPLQVLGGAHSHTVSVVTAAVGMTVGTAGTSVSKENTAIGRGMTVSSAVTVGADLTLTKQGLALATPYTSNKTNTNVPLISASPSASKSSGSSSSSSAPEQGSFSRSAEHGSGLGAGLGAGLGMTVVTAGPDGVLARWNDPLTAAAATATASAAGVVIAKAKARARAMARAKAKTKASIGSVSRKSAITIDDSGDAEANNGEDDDSDDDAIVLSNSDDDGADGGDTSDEWESENKYVATQSTATERELIDDLGDDTYAAHSPFYRSNRNSSSAAATAHAGDEEESAQADAAALRASLLVYRSGSSVAATTTSATAAARALDRLARRRQRQWQQRQQQAQSLLVNANGAGEIDLNNNAMNDEDAGSDANAHSKEYAGVRGDTGDSTRATGVGGYNDDEDESALLTAIAFSAGHPINAHTPRSHGGDINADRDSDVDNTDNDASDLDNDSQRLGRRSGAAVGKTRSGGLSTAVAAAAAAGLGYDNWSDDDEDGSLIDNADADSNIGNRRAGSRGRGRGRGRGGRGGANNADSAGADGRGRGRAPKGHNVRMLAELYGAPPPPR